VALAGLALLFTLAGTAQAQPFGAWLTLSGPTSGYVQVPSAGVLNPASTSTIEAWVKRHRSGGCSSIVGKNWMQAWWVGLCGTTMRSYIRGYDSTSTRGADPHLPGRREDPGRPVDPRAVTFDGTTRSHYINASSWAPGWSPGRSGDLRRSPHRERRKLPAYPRRGDRRGSPVERGPHPGAARASINGLTGPATAWSRSGA